MRWRTKPPRQNGSRTPQKNIVRYVRNQFAWRHFQLLKMTEKTQDPNFAESILHSTHHTSVSIITSLGNFFTHVFHKPQTWFLQCCLIFCYIWISLWCISSFSTVKHWDLTIFCSHSALVRQCEPLRTNTMVCSKY